ncbi:ABC transporter permease [Streptomyces anulatus]|uniref:ABC transporter permease n=1 Tax=Streptomyces TaxID=1883 RepID=UPI00067B3703|nr:MULTISPECIES: ABC transporter permease [Streptomyces]KND25077.1 ABC transporter permease [Streptomyces europaeiscabiei]KPL29831.1 ABC transporter permease [Streptomyces anulatus]MBT1100643.1 ABC transporter permease [Streptomyces sp. Tu10]OKI78766.1 ABC transporter permease [Streptomyces sp. TSRI0395]WSR79690.1 ABC transporter permease [Streptomyces anulatus]
MSVTPAAGPAGPPRTGAPDTGDAPPPGLVAPRPQLRRPRSRSYAVTVRALGPVVLLALWWAASATGLLTADVLASPAEVFRAVGELWGNGQLPDALTTSLTRSGLGLIVGLAAGLTLGIVTGFTRLGDELLDSSLQTLRTIPFLSLVPLFMVWFGINETAKILLIAVATTFPMYVSTSSGVRTTDPKLIEAMRAFGMSRLGIVREVVLPGALPSLLAGLRLSMTLSVIALIAAEEINATAGIGYLMSQAQSYARTDILAVCILVYGLLGLTADILVRLLERVLMPWRTPQGARR